MLSVIIPVYNRLENLKVCLEALANQKTFNRDGDISKFLDFEIIVVDDGSTDGVRDWLYQTYIVYDAEDEDGTSFDDEFRTRNFLIDPKGSQGSQLTYLSGGPNKGFRGGRARNIGAFNAEGDRFVFIDSDVVLNEYGLMHYANAAVASSDAVIVGRYFYLPPIDMAHKDLLWQARDYKDLSYALDRLGSPVTTEPGDVTDYGNDLGGRPESDYTEDPHATKKSDGLGALSGNISYPKDLFLAMGGFDEKIVGHGGEDADLGLTASKQFDVEWLFYKPIVGFHIWHTRDQERNLREVQANIRYIDAKHGVGTYANAQKTSESRDFSDPIHYHKHAGAIAIKLQFDQTIYAARPDLMTMIGITDPKWFSRLGFRMEEVLIVDKTSLDRYTVSGRTEEK